MDVLSEISTVGVWRYLKAGMKKVTSCFLGGKMFKIVKTFTIDSNYSEKEFVEKIGTHFRRLNYEVTTADNVVSLIQLIELNGIKNSGKFQIKEISSGNFELEFTIKRKMSGNRLLLFLIPFIIPPIGVITSMMLLSKQSIEQKKLDKKINSIINDIKHYYAE